MFFRHRSKAIVITRQDKGDYDRIFTVYTENFGKIKVLGRSIRKAGSKLRFGMEALALVEIEFIEGKVYKTLTDVVILNNYWNVKSDLKKVSLVGKVMSDFDSMVKAQESDREIWNILIETFNILNKSSYHSVFYYFFVWRTLFSLGYGPNFYNCASCKKRLAPSEDFKFIFKEGGIFCHKCFKEDTGVEFYTISAELIKIIRVATEKDIKFVSRIRIDKREDQALSEFSEKYINFNELR